MATLNFPDNPVNGQVYPSNPLPGQNVYYWDATYQTWRLTGTATGVAADTYGTAASVGSFTVDAAGRITFAEDIAIAIEATSVAVNPTINGKSTVQEVLEDAIYNISSPNLLVTEAADGNVTITLPNTLVTPGTYDYATVTVNSEGRVTAASTNTLPVASTTSPGIVQLVDNTTTNSTTEALTASVGVDLQQQIDALLPSFVEIDDISSGFDGAAGTFNLNVSGSPYTPNPPSNIMVFLGGVAQTLGVAYVVSGDQVIFAEPPIAGTSFYATTVALV